VSSFGIGGTNAHVVLEEAPEVIASALSEDREGEGWEMLPLSARTGPALEEVCQRLAQHLQGAGAGERLSNVAYTLQHGRRRFEWRRVVLARSTAEAAGALAGSGAGRVVSGGGVSAGQRPVIFLFPGQGAQRAGMGQRLYERAGRYRREVDECAGVLMPLLGFDLREVLYPAAGKAEEARERLRETAVAQPALFVTEYALAQLLMERGVVPAAVLGHSLGEYVAATLAGVFGRDEALVVVAARGRLMQQAERGAMLSVSVGEEEARRVVAESGGAEAGLWLAACNGPGRSVVSGREAAVAELERRLAGSGVGMRRLETSHGFHSGLMAGVRAEFERELAGVELKWGEQVRSVSNVTGRWLTREQACGVEYWGQQLREPVRFGAGVEQVLELGGADGVVLVEVGPGRGLTNLARQVAGPRTMVSVLLDEAPAATESPTVAAFSEIAEPDQVCRAAAEVWLAGGRLNWPPPTTQQTRLQLPAYPFQRQPFWIEARKASASTTVAESNVRANQEIENSPAMASTKTALPVSDDARRVGISRKLKTLLHELSGIDAGVISEEENFFELGFDSLLLMQVSQAIKNQFGVDVAFRQLFEEFSSLDLLTSYLDEMLPREERPIAAVERTPGADATLPLAEQLSIALTQDSGAALTCAERLPHLSRTMLGQVISQQMQLMSQQLSLLQNAQATGLADRLPDETGEISSLRGVPGAQSNGRTASQSTFGASGPSNVSTEAIAAEAFEERTSKAGNEAFGPWRPVKSSKRVSPGSGLTPSQQKHLDALMARYNHRTQESKRMTQAYRAVLADTRVSAGFRLPWKELVYPIVGTRAEGARLWDVDDNEYVDLVMGFGVNLFGHSPPFIVKALAEQLKQGIQIGPQSRMAGQVAELFSTLTGMERMTFCNTGSEAVMAALRLARTVTGRKKIALFAGSYHGITDEVLARTQTIAGSRKTVPAATGIMPNMSENVLVLDYGRPETLELLETQGEELAAVLVEPVQSSRPELQPTEFLCKLRGLTEKSGTALIFDEMITGFRLHPGGAQAWFGVQADIATYGKVIGGGMPIGIVAGKAAYLDAVDGGMWTYGDDSYPQTNQTFFAGTFSKHPLAIAAAWAVLNHLKDAGPGLQQQLNERTAQMAARLNAYFEQADVPAQVRYCGSLFRFVISGEAAFSTLLIYHLLEKGIFIADRGGFLSTAHTTKDIDFIVGAIEESVEDLRRGGFLSQSSSAPPESLPATPSNQVPAAPAAALDHDGDRPQMAAISVSRKIDVRRIRTVRLTAAQKGLLVVALMSDEASRAYNEAMTLRLRGALNVGAMEQSLRMVVARHESLRTTFDLEDDSQQIAASVILEIPLHDFSAIEPGARQARTTDWLKKEIGKPFDLLRGPVLRVCLVKLAAEEHLLVLTTHHLLTDGWSFDILLEEIIAFYNAECQGVACSMPPATQFSEYALWQAAQHEDAAVTASESYWVEQFSDGAPVLNLPTNRSRPQVQTYAGSKQRVRIDATVARELKAMSGRHKCTIFITLLGGFQLLLHQISGQHDLVVGTHSAGQSMMQGSQHLIGFCINMLPMRSRINDENTFADLLANTKRTVLEGYKHQNYPLLSLVRKLNLVRDPSRPPLVSVIFNMDRSISKDGASPHPRNGGLEVEMVENPVVFARFDLLWNMIDTGKELLLECTYNTDLFDSASVNEWMQRFSDLLRCAARRPDSKLRELAVSVAAAAIERETAQHSTLSHTRLERFKSTKRRAVDAAQATPASPR
jgi:glutamate-1-semialdehyde aminotransferase/acyl carrier protein